MCVYVCVCVNVFVSLLISTGLYELNLTFSRSLSDFRREILAFESCRIVSASQATERHVKGLSRCLGNSEFSNLALGESD